MKISIAYTESERNTARQIADLIKGSFPFLRRSEEPPKDDSLFWRIRLFDNRKR